MHRLYPLLHLAKEPCVFSEIKSITLHLCGFTFIYAEIKSNTNQLSFRLILHWLSLRGCHVMNERLEKNEDSKSELINSLSGSYCIG